MNDISDHGVVNCKLHFIKPQPMLMASKFRDFRKIDHDAFARELTEHLHDVTCEGDVDTAVVEFNSAVNCALDIHAPLLTSKPKPKRAKPRWYNNDVDDARRGRRQAERKWRKSRLPSDHTNFEQSKRKLAEVLVKAKSVFYRESLIGSSPNEVFRIVNNLTG